MTKIYAVGALNALVLLGSVWLLVTTGLYATTFGMLLLLAVVIGAAVGAWAIRRMLQAEAATTPVAAHIDDAQTSDPTPVESAPRARFGQRFAQRRSDLDATDEPADERVHDRLNRLTARLHETVAEEAVAPLPVLGGVADGDTDPTPEPARAELASLVPGLRYAADEDEETEEDGWDEAEPVDLEADDDGLDVDEGAYATMSSLALAHFDDHSDDADEEAAEDLDRPLDPTSDVALGRDALAPVSPLVDSSLRRREPLFANAFDPSDESEEDDAFVADADDEYYDEHDEAAVAVDPGVASAPTTVADLSSVIAALDRAGLGDAEDVAAWSALLSGMDPADPVSPDDAAAFRDWLLAQVPTSVADTMFAPRAA